MSDTLKVFLVDYGLLMTEDNKDFKAYSNVYDHKYGYYDYGQFYVETMDKAHKFVNQFINDTILEEDKTFVGLYGVISETFIYPDEIDEDVSEATVEGESYDTDSIKFSVAKFRNSKIEENFIKT